MQAGQLIVENSAGFNGLSDSHETRWRLGLLIGSGPGSYVHAYAYMPILMEVGNISHYIEASTRALCKRAS